MKKSRKNNLIKFIFLVFLFSFLIIYFSSMTGYYEYQNYNKKNLTEDKIKQFEQDIKDGKNIDINDYVDNKSISYNNKLSLIFAKFSNVISDTTSSVVEYSFNFLFRLIDE